MKVEGTSKELSQDSIEALYYLAHTQYSQGKYEDALSIFKMLTITDKRTRKHWMGLGACYQMLKKYAQALDAYETAAVLDPVDPPLHLHAADCLFALGAFKEALFALDCAERAIKMSSSPNLYKNLSEHIDLIRKAWNNVEMNEGKPCLKKK